ncbi:glycerol dehydrogenase-like iron-containing ADH family enzyme [Xanthobacter flavus]|uniref:Glycerol dehydrogenase-like iron-containing ADH family enzyme n=1 Tax=Xanthobacter flavus TaxID=281 RepID=A0A9W6CK89_XANFL|nr:hypothetical protein [Xanthobacter flavus]MDR6332907.1 glycerol dehydrogenase-like iron-containing ADH family enzyme [Xanthobacter flavus]GLI21185.1 hypothetical protein XFLAVUS301_08590 [Xanthobacter flavus]
MKAITGEALVKRLVTLRGKFFYTHERGGEHRLHAALNAFEHEALTLQGAEVAFASQNEVDYASRLWGEVHEQALDAFRRLGERRNVYGLIVPPRAPPQFAPSPILVPSIA